jgi:hypothetical protein
MFKRLVLVQLEAFILTLARTVYTHRDTISERPYRQKKDKTLDERVHKTGLTILQLQNTSLNKLDKYRAIYVNRRK